MRLALLLPALCLTPTLLMADDAKPAAGAVSLFDGKSLDGWKVVKCEAEVKDGCIFLKDGNGWLHTEKQYADFVLDFDCKALSAEMWDSGIYVRAELPPERANWPGRNQINLRKGMEGSIKEYKAAVARPELFKPGQWNHFRVTVVGRSATLEINGQQAWKLDDMKPATGYIGLQCEVPGGGQFLFRDVRLTPR